MPCASAAQFWTEAGRSALFVQFNQQCCSYARYSCVMKLWLRRFACAFTCRSMPAHNFCAQHQKKQNWIRTIPLLPKIHLTYTNAAVKRLCLKICLHMSAFVWNCRFTAVANYRMRRDWWRDYVFQKSLGQGCNSQKRPQCLNPARFCFIWAHLLPSRIAVTRRSLMVVCAVRGDAIMFGKLSLDQGFNWQ